MRHRFIITGSWMVILERELDDASEEELEFDAIQEAMSDDNYQNVDTIEHDPDCDACLDDTSE